MPKRKIPIDNHHLYHVYNSGVTNTNTFTHKYHFQKAIEGLWYYRYQRPPIRLAYFKNLTPQAKEKYLQELRNSPLLIDIVAFVLMPTHFHLIVKQHVSGGTSRFMANMQNSYTRYFNAHKDRRGPLFNRQFEAMPIETADQLLNLSKFIHLKPLTHGKIKSIPELLEYPWSSLPEHLETKPEMLRFCNRDPIRQKIHTATDYETFIKDLDSLPHQTELISTLLFS